jgi:hypothetical protein
MWSGALAAAAMVVGLSCGASANSGQFIGNWVNTDPGTRDVTRVVVTPAGPNQVKVQVFGQCHPTDCDWGIEMGHGYADSVASNDVRIVTARFNPGFKKSLVILRLAPAGLRYTILSDFTDNSGRTDYETNGMLKKAMMPLPLPMPMPMPHPLPVPMAEDCISFNPMQVQASFVGGAWKVVQGSMWMLDFGGNKPAAYKSADIIRSYGFNQQCFVKRPNAVMTYWKVGNSVPSGAMPGQDCVNNNPATTTVGNFGGNWKVVDGSHWMMDFGPDKAAADQALSVIKRYNLNRQCFVARPNPPFAYWLAQ